MLHAGTNVLFHAEGGHYATHLEPPVKFEALNYQVAASVALQEGQNGLGTPLVNVDGSLCDHASFMGEDLYGSFGDLDASLMVRDHTTPWQPNSLYWRPC